MTAALDFPPVYPGIFSTQGEPHLMGGYCPCCDSYQFPALEICANCLGEVESVNLGGTGTLYSLTTIRTKPPLGLPTPYRVGYVDLDSAPLRIFTLLDSAQSPLSLGQNVHLKVAQVGLNSEGKPCLRPYFTGTDS